MYRELNPLFRFTSEENAALCGRLLEIKVNPYKAYLPFKTAVRQAIASSDAISRFREAVALYRSQSSYESPFFFVENCPIDPFLPVFGNDDPVTEKYLKKKTYVAEGFLQMFAELSSQHPISYVNVNDGDIFQDIFPKEALKNTQSQKALGPIHFHKDLANHFVRPDFVNILALRSSDDNEIHTTFVSNHDILHTLDDHTKELLRQKAFYTPYDDLTTRTNNVDVGRAADHPVLSGAHDLRFFENRTVGLNVEAEAALQKLVQVLHSTKKRVLMRPGDFVSISNNLSLHGKEMGAIRDENARKIRWSMKTVNVYSCAPYLKHYVDGTDYLVNG